LSINFWYQEAYDFGLTVMADVFIEQTMTVAIVDQARWCGLMIATWNVACDGKVRV
jgi:hypothetical protein